VYLYIEFIIFYKAKRAKFKLKKYCSFLYWIDMTTLSDYFKFRYFLRRHYYTALLYYSILILIETWKPQTPLHATCKWQIFYEHI